MPQDNFSGVIPQIGGKEKRGQKVNRPIDPAYIQELISKGKITPQLAAQLPNQSVVDYINEQFPVNIPSSN